MTTTWQDLIEVEKIGNQTNQWVPERRAIENGSGSVAVVIHGLHGFKIQLHKNRVWFHIDLSQEEMMAIGMACIRAATGQVEVSDELG